MKLLKAQVLENLRNMEFAEIALFAEDLIDPLEHIQLCTALQKLIRRVEKSDRQVYEVTT